MSIVKLQKRLELEAYVTVNEYIIIAITESWATCDVNDGELGLDGFVLFQKDRRVIRDGKGGGVLLYGSSEYKCVEIADLNARKCESVWVKIYESSRDG